MKTRKLGNLTVSAVGLGCMGFSTGYGEIPPEEESIRLIRLAHEMGCTLFDTAEVYAVFRNETLVGKALAPIRDEIVLVSKYSPSPLPGQDFPEGKTSRDGLRRALEDSLKRLQTDHLDLYLVHRLPPEDDATVEELAAWFGELIREGKILGWGLSEVTADMIRRAHKVTPLTAVESEYSMMARQWEEKELPVCEELGIGFMAYAPMGGRAALRKNRREYRVQGRRYSPHHYTVQQGKCEKEPPRGGTGGKIRRREGRDPRADFAGVGDEAAFCRADPRHEEGRAHP